MELFAKEITARGKGEVEVRFHGGTLLAKEMEIMNAVKAGNVAIGSPAGAAATVFPEMGVLLVPYLVKDYAQAYSIMNGKIGDTLDKQFQEKYKLKVLYYFDYGFRHFWTNGSAIVEPKESRGKKIRVQSQRCSPIRSMASGVTRCRWRGARSSRRPSRASLTAATCRLPTSMR